MFLSLSSRTTTHIWILVKVCWFNERKCFVLEYFSSFSEGGTAPSVLNTHLSHKEMTVEKCFLFLVT